MKNNIYIEEYRSLIKMLDSNIEVFYIYTYDKEKQNNSSEYLGYVKYDVFNHRLSKYIEKDSTASEEQSMYSPFTPEQDLRFTKHLYALETIKNFLKDNKMLFDEKNISLIFYFLADYFNLEVPIFKKIDYEDFFSFVKKSKLFSSYNDTQLETFKKLVTDINNVTKVIADEFKLYPDLLILLTNKKISEL